MVKTKIIATLGPSTRKVAVLRRMMFAGLDIVRLNFSHSSNRENLESIHKVRELNRRYRRHIRVLGDLEGYRIRVGSLKKPLELKKKQRVILRQGLSAKKAGEIPFDYEGSLKNIACGQHVYIDDGNICLLVSGKGRDYLAAAVAAGGILKEHKGINMPGARLEFGGISDKDREDIRFCLENGVDFVAQSFVRSKQDIMQVRKLFGRSSFTPEVIAKIENREGIRNIKEILSASDGIMIARGDMGVSLPVYEVPFVQKEIIDMCRRQGKFSVTATQMLESMTHNLRPTRAEVSDVANAVIDGSDYLMLSAETSVGEFPAQAVKMMNDIIKFSENYLSSRRAF